MVPVLHHSSASNDVSAGIATGEVTLVRKEIGGMEHPIREKDKETTQSQSLKDPNKAYQFPDNGRAGSQVAVDA